MSYEPFVTCVEVQMAGEVIFYVDWFVREGRLVLDRYDPNGRMGIKESLPRNWVLQPWLG